jgi:hypothetical protein
MRQRIFVSDGKLFVAVCVTRIPNIGVVIRNSKSKLKYSDRQGSR